jgi:hypothetical protein
LHDIFLSVPSARGWHPSTVSCYANMRTVLERYGHRLHLATVYRMPLDLARNELALALHESTADLQLWLDDDCWIEPIANPRNVMALIDCIEHGCDIAAAACRMRNVHGGPNHFNIDPISEIGVAGQTRVVEVQWCGFGAVMIHRRVFEKMYADAIAFDKRLFQGAYEEVGQMRPDVEPRTYASQMLPGKVAASLFKTMNIPARLYSDDAPEGVAVPSLDDKAFCFRAREAGFKIHAAIDVTTCHDGMIGNFGEELAKMQAAAAERIEEERLAGNPAAIGSGLVDNMGRPLR